MSIVRKKVIWLVLVTAIVVIITFHCWIRYYGDVNREITSKHITRAKLLVLSGANVRSSSPFSNPLQSAVFYNKKDLVKLILRRGVGANDINNSLCNYLNSSDIGIVKDLIAYSPDINKAGPEGITPIACCIGGISVEKIKLLLSAGADVNAVDNSKRTLISKAAEWGNTPLIELLLSHHADIKIRDDKGNSPLDYAALNNYPLDAKLNI